MIQGQLIARRSSDQPPIYRVVIDRVEIGSISLQTRHVHPMQTYWHWGVDAPDGSRRAGHPAVTPNHQAASKTR